MNIVFYLIQSFCYGIRMVPTTYKTRLGAAGLAVWSGLDGFIHYNIYQLWSGFLVGSAKENAG